MSIKATYIKYHDRWHQSELRKALGTRASVVRIGLWTIVALAVSLSILQSQSPVRQEFANWDNPSGVELSQYPPKQSPDNVRVAIVGSSEIFDYKKRTYSLGLTISSKWSQKVRGPVEVYERTQAALNTREKRIAVAEAVESDMDLIIVSLPIGHIQNAGKQNRAHDIEIDDGWLRYSNDLPQPPPPPKDDTLVAEDNRSSILYRLSRPTEAVHRMLNGLFPGYRLNIMRQRHGDDQEERERFLQEKKNEVVLGQHSGVTADIIRKMTEELTDSAVQSNTPVILFAAPVETKLLNATQEALVTRYSDEFAEAVSALTGPSLTIYNGLEKRDIPAEHFNDLTHINTFSQIAEELLLLVEERYPHITSSELTDR